MFCSKTTVTTSVTTNRSIPVQPVYTLLKYQQFPFTTDASSIPCVIIYSFINRRVVSMWIWFLSSSLSLLFKEDHSVLSILSAFKHTFLITIGLQWCHVFREYPSDTIILSIEDNQSLKQSAARQWRKLFLHKSYQSSHIYTPFFVLRPFWCDPVDLTIRRHQMDFVPPSFSY